MTVVSLEKSDEPNKKHKFAQYKLQPKTKHTEKHFCVP